MNSNEQAQTTAQPEIEVLQPQTQEMTSNGMLAQTLAGTSLEDWIHLAALNHDISLSLIQTNTLANCLQQCTQALVTHLGAAFARIWTLNSDTNVLELQASAGLYTHLNGPHSRIPVGSFKIGQIAAERLPHLTNAVIGDPRVSDQEWARQEGMVAFAGYPLLIEGNLVGVIAVFARNPISTSGLDALASISNAIALGIVRKRVEDDRSQLLNFERRAREEAEASKIRLARILDELPDGLFIFDTEWRYTYINPHATPYTGKPWQELLGKNVWEEFPELIGSIYFQQYHKAVEQQQSVAFELYSDTLAGWFDIHAYPIPDGLVVYFRNITTRKQAEEERDRHLKAEQLSHLEAEKARQQVIDIVESITDAFFALDNEWRFTYLNAQSEPLLQRKRADLLGKNIWEEFPASINSIFYRQYFRAHEQQISVSFEEYYPPLESWFEINAYPGPDGLSVYFRNIDERKQAEKERLRLLEAAEIARAEAEAALLTRNNFLSSVSHDLKTPLSTMRGVVQLLQRQLKRGLSPEPAALAERLQLIESSTMKMKGMVDDLLDVAMLQSGQKLELDLHLIPLLPFIQKLVAEQHISTQQHEIHIQTTEENIVVYGDPARLDRVLTNLLSNAIKYSPKGGTITVELTQQVAQNQQWSVINIHDQGLGIPATDLPHIFEPFYRAGNVAGHIQGTGVGLASVAQVIAQHGGTISVTSEEGRGSTFIISLPVVADNDTDTTYRDASI